MVRVGEQVQFENGLRSLYTRLLPRFTHVIWLLQMNLIPKHLYKTWFNKCKAHHNLWGFHVDSQLFSCVFFMLFFKTQFLIIRRLLVIGTTFILLKEDVCILYSSPSSPHQSPVGCTEPFYSMEGSSHLPAYVHIFDFYTFSSIFIEPITENKKNTY